MTIIFSVSPQSLASLATHFDLSPLDTFLKLKTFLTDLGVVALFDGSTGRDFSLHETALEFVQRRGISEGATYICSSCPGWICYAEKKEPDLLPLISSVKSPQQIMGRLIKQHYAPLLEVPIGQLYHVTIMPCFDRKLEVGSY